VTLADMTMRIGQEGGSVGRGKNNSWVLPDPERFLSSVHMEIAVKHDQYFVVDHSTNGTFHNQSAAPIGKGSEVILSDGDSLRLGDYEIQVSLLKSLEVESSDYSVPVVGPFDSNVSEPADIAVSCSSPVNFSDSSLRATVDNSNFIQQAPPLFNEEAILDPLVAFSVSESLDMPIHATTQGDSHDVLHHSISMPQLIPDDWDARPVAQSAPGSPKISQQLNGSSTPVKSDFNQPDPVISEPDESGFGHASELIRQKKSKAVNQEASNSKIKSKKSCLTEKNSSQTVTHENEALILAMGLNIDELNQQQINSINTVVGEFVQETVKGLMLILNSRSSIKNEFRMNVTTIQSVENNPLKFSPNLDDAMTNMFIKTGTAYKDPVASVKEGIESIADHQLSVFAGMRAAFNYFLERFNPELLEAKFNKQKSSVLATKKARNWDLYSEFYRDLVKDRDDSFQYLFGDEFVHTYEQQMQKLKLSRSK
jgi:type VI secretion system FHA domain protein